jgi:hypothetical protein
MSNIDSTHDTRHQLPEPPNLLVQSMTVDTLDHTAQPCWNFCIPPAPIRRKSPGTAAISGACPL